MFLLRQRRGTDPSSGASRSTSLRQGRRRLFSGLLAAASVALVAPVPAALAGASPPVMTLVDLNGHFPIGVPDSSEPSGYGPPTRTALVGYRESYVTDFDGTSVPPGWSCSAGYPGATPEGTSGSRTSR